MSLRLGTLLLVLLTAAPSRAGTTTDDTPWSPKPGVCERFDVLTRLYTDPEATLSLDDVKAALSNRDGSRVTVDNPHTFCCTVAELSDPPRLHLCVGRPAGGQLRTFECASAGR